jgi:putative protease
MYTEHDHQHHDHGPRPKTRPVPELLAPAGGPEAFDAALAAGADAIFCGFGNDFNARRSAKNFSPEEFEAACRKAHLAGTRVYVTVNVVIRTEELPMALALVRNVWLLGADAFIIQDWGLLAEVRRRWPQIECHISTQANVHDARGVAWCKARGAERVTLSRELSLPEIARIAQEGVELEGFGHGALCFCYSGICMLSSLSGGRSANRGLCAQPCRLLYKLVDEDGRVLTRPGMDRPLCPKDFCTIDDLAALTDAGLGSLKIEGRMKAPDYVHAVVSAYRGALDDLARGETPDDDRVEARHEQLRRAFNRDFTNSYLFGTSGDEMMSYERSNNRGELVGSVVSSRDLGGARVRRGGRDGGRERFRHVTRAEVTIALDKHVDKGDLLEIRPIDDPSQFLTAHVEADAVAGERIVCKTVRPMAAGCPVRVIRSQRAFDAAASVSVEVPRKRPVAVNVIACKGRPFTVELTTFGPRGGRPLSARASGFVVEEARTRAVTPEEIREHVERMGTTPFEPVGFAGMFDPGIGMSFSAVHKVRSEACKALEQVILSSYEGREQGLASVPDAEDLALQAGCHVGDSPQRDSWDEVAVCVLAPTVEAAQAALDAGATRVYATADALKAQDGWPKGVIPWLDEVCREIDHDRLDPYVREGQHVAVGNVSELALAAERGALAEIRPCIPIHNTAALATLVELGAGAVWLSAELTLKEVCALGRAARVPVGLVVYGRTRAMTSEHCVLQVAGRCCHDCARCTLRTQRHFLKDKDGGLLPVQTDLQGRSRIYAARQLDATPQVRELVESGVTQLMVDATLLTSDEAAAAVRRVASAVAAARLGRKPASREEGSTAGHLYQGIE